MARGRKGILIQAGNGPVIGYDETGLRMRLSNETVREIADRLPSPEARRRLNPMILGDVDAWNVEQTGDWLCFDAKLPSYSETRRFRKHVTRPGIIAEPPGRLLGLFSVGGPMRCDHIDATLAHPAHIVTTDDDIGAVGMGGLEDGETGSGATPVRHATLDTLTADAFVGIRRAAGGASPVIYTRCETDSSTSIAAFCAGPALRNFDRALGNFCAAAASFGVPAKLLPITVDYSAEDVLSTGSEYLSGLHELLDAITGLAAKHNLSQPTFLLPFPAHAAHHKAHFAFSIISGTHKVIYSGPASQFARDPFLRPTPEGLHQHAQLNARILQELMSGQGWHCPRLLLAERSGEKTIRVTTDATSPLVIAQSATKSGIALRANGKSVAYASLKIAKDDPQAFDITLKAAVPTAVTLIYGEKTALGLRDSFEGTSFEGRPLHRWALPAELDVTGC